MDVCSFIGNRTLEKRILSSGCIDSRTRVREFRVIFHWFGPYVWNKFILS